MTRWMKKPSNSSRTSTDDRQGQDDGQLLLDDAVGLAAGLMQDANAEFGLEGGIDRAKIREMLEGMGLPPLQHP